MLDDTTSTPQVKPSEEVPAPDAAQPLAALPLAAPPLAATAPYPPIPPVPAFEPPKKRGCRGCLLGCLGVLLAFVLIALVAAGWFFNWPAQWGLVDTPSERLFASSPDPYAAEALTAELESQGVTMTGIALYVLPSQETTGQIAYFLVEDAEGAKWSHAEYKSPAEGLLMLAAASKAAADHEIVRVAVDHRDADGLQVAVMTAPVDALRAYVAGDIPQEQLFERMNGYADMAGYLAGMQE